MASSEVKPYSKGEASQFAAKTAPEPKPVGLEIKESATTSEPQMSADDFMTAFADALSKGDAGAIQEILRQAPRSAEAVNALKGFLAVEGLSKDAKRYAAETLMRIGTQESVSFVLDQALAAQRSGDSTAFSTLVSSFDSPTTPEGAQVLFDFLLGSGSYAVNAGALPEEIRDAARKALRNAPDHEAIGNLAATLYLDPQVSGNNAALSELFEGIAHPNMLSALAVRAYQGGSPENANQFLDRLAGVPDQRAVQAMLQAGTTEPRLFQAAAERLYAWSVQHPQQAQPGLFLEYLTDSRRNPSERILAAYGLAGVPNNQEALQTFSKALAEEANPEVKASLAALQGYLNQNQIPK